MPKCVNSVSSSSCQASWDADGTGSNGLGGAAAVTRVAPQTLTSTPMAQTVSEVRIVLYAFIKILQHFRSAPCVVALSKRSRRLTIRLRRCCGVLSGRKAAEAAVVFHPQDA